MIGLGSDKKKKNTEAVIFAGGEDYEPHRTKRLKKIFLNESSNFVFE